MKPKKQRDAAPVVIKRLREALAVVPGVKIDLRAMKSINISSGNSKYEYTLKSGSTDDLYRIVPQMLDKLAKLEGLRDVATNLDVNPQMKVEIDREKAAVYGITMDQIRQELFNAFGSRPISTIYTPSNSYQVILETLPELQSNTDGLVPTASQDRERTNRPARSGRAPCPHGGSAASASSRSASGRDHLVQPCAWILARTRP